MKHRRPVKITIMSVDYKISWVPPTHEKVKGAFGIFDSVEQTIYMCNDMTPTKMAETFLHELVHAILSHIGFTDMMKMSEKKFVILEEHLTCHLSCAIQTVLLQNPQQLKWYLSLLRLSKS